MQYLSPVSKINSARGVYEIEFYNSKVLSLQALEVLIVTTERSLVA